MKVQNHFLSMSTAWIGISGDLGGISGPDKGAKQEKSRQAALFASPVLPPEGAALFAYS